VKTVVWRVEIFDEIDSTNAWLTQRARNDAPEGLVALARYQSAGRGRRDRTWEAPVDSALLTSLLFRSSFQGVDRQWASVVVALSARAALVRLCGLRPQLKWPNDVVVNGAKLGGLLAESSASPVEGDFVVVGLGLNLTSAPEGLPATSVRDETGVTLVPEGLLDLILEEIDHRLEQLASEGTIALRSEYRSALSTLNRRVRIEEVNQSFEGRATDVNEQGHLVIVRDDETVQSVATGDVVHLRVIDETAS